MEKVVNTKYIAAVTAIAFLWSVVLPFFAVYDPSFLQASAHSNTNSISEEKILICTPEGFKWVNVKDLQTDEEDQEKPHPQYKCALCYVNAHGVKFTAPCESLVSVYLLSFKFITFHINEETPTNFFTSDRLRSRAPPSIL